MTTLPPPPDGPNSAPNSAPDNASADARFTGPEISDFWRPVFRREYDLRQWIDKRSGTPNLRLISPTRRFLSWVAALAAAAFVLCLGLGRLSTPLGAKIAVAGYALLWILWSGEIRWWTLAGDGFEERFPFRPWRRRKIGDLERVEIDYYPDGLWGREYRVRLMGKRSPPADFLGLELTENLPSAYALGALLSLWYGLPLLVYDVPPEDWNGAVEKWIKDWKIRAGVDLAERTRIIFSDPTKAT